MRMKKRVFSLLLAVILITALIAGCGARSKSAKSESYDAAPQEAPAAEAMAPNEDVATQSNASMGRGDVSPEEAAGATAITGSGVASQNVSNAILSQRKIIQKANVTIEVDNFDAAYGKINTFILGVGFIQESNINTEKVYTEDDFKLYKKGVIVIRVDKDEFQKVLSDVKGLGTVFNENIGADDVTERYFDVESRLRLLKYEESRLEDYLKKLEDPDKIFRTESRLTDIRHEIESLTVNLRKLSDLVELSTITINMSEKIPGKDEPGLLKSKTYGGRLLGNFLNSVKGVVSFCGELLIILVQVLPVLVLIGLFVILIIYVYRKVSKARGKSIIKKDKDSLE
jgi:uncharacterized protein (UPF0333 family)